MIPKEIIVLLLMLCCCNVSDSDMVKLIVKVKDEFRGHVDTVMNYFGFKFYRQIIEGIYTYANENPDNCTDNNIRHVHLLLDGKVDYIERSRNLYTTVSPIEGMRLHYEDPVEAPSTNGKECAQRYVDIQDHWKHTGRGVVVAIVDSGIDDRDPVIRTKISKILSYNFVNDFRSHTPPFSSHGTFVANLIAGEHEPDDTSPSCDCGISPDVTFADLKVGSLVATTQQHFLMVDGEILSRGLAARQDIIDIYCNTWELGPASVDVQSYTVDILQKGFHNGRKGKGNIFVFPSENPGHGIANKYTITVGWIESEVTQHSNRVPNAATLVSVFTKSNTSSSTLSKQDQFKATRTQRLDKSSTATALLSGILALALQANPSLTARDVKHLLVESASQKGLLETQDFKQNHAGYRYHKFLGFGYPDVNRMLELANTWKDLAKLQSFTIKGGSSWLKSSERHIKIGCEDSEQCNHRLEQLQVKIQTDLPNSSQGNIVSIIATSPKRTSSILFEQTYIPGDIQERETVQMVFLTNHFWGEDPVGLWTIKLVTYSEDTVSSRYYVDVLEIAFDATGSDCRLTEIRKSELPLILFFAICIICIAILCLWCNKIWKKAGKSSLNITKRDGTSQEQEEMMKNR
ncbi:endoprotease aex-5-like [Dreissena polymorpha]|uniref:P/Homo B domain-containing protein n=1 Tax=Dreissena polymorpha TaxID=45954 RepID=A0A9D4D195_DREPO|nr:endoprotease aex-5-like [Dreissena polymorpha]KAH3735498.1 hypothetical protein DPMN_042031 [Dreissena polymorpha]